MIYSRVIIIGGGPAGSTCAWKLRQNDIECIILDKQKYPRNKLCAGWITPGVLRDLQMDPENYPHSLTKFLKFHVHIYSKELEISVRQYAIRRYEFDYWLLKRCGAEVCTHEVKSIIKDGDSYIIDDRFRCRYLVGAGGTFCPVYRTFFKQINPRAMDNMVTTLEEEFPCDFRDSDCHLWFFQNKLSGYSWYVPKVGGFVNVGIGGFSENLKSKKNSISDHWKLFIEELEKHSLVDNRQFNAKGSVYFIRDGIKNVQTDRAYIIGDAAGMATKDMGEGIGPAVKSGILAAEAIYSNKPLCFDSIGKYSFSRIKTVLAMTTAFLFKSG